MKKSTTATPVRATAIAPSIAAPVIRRPSINKRALAARKAHRDRDRDHRQHQHQHEHGHEVSSNYAPRVLAGQFEPTALRARKIASDRGQSLHELAHELGYAPPPPQVRVPVDLTAHTRTEIATITGYLRSDVSRLFARKHPPTLTKLAKVAAVYGAWLDDMLTALGW